MQQQPFIDNNSMNSSFLQNSNDIGVFSVQQNQNLNQQFPGSDNATVDMNGLLLQQSSIETNVPMMNNSFVANNNNPTRGFDSGSSNGGGGGGVGGGGIGTEYNMDFGSSIDDDSNNMNFARRNPNNGFGNIPNGTSGGVGSGINYDDNPTVKVGLLLVMAMLYVVVGMIGQYSIRARLLMMNDWFMIFAQFGGIVLSCIGEHFYSNGHLRDNLERHCLHNVKDTFHALVPALCDHLYVIFIFLALPNLSMAAYEFTHEDKLVVTAIVSCLLLKNRFYLPRQWIFLLLISFCIAWVAETRNKYSFLIHIVGDHTTHFIGLLLIFLSSLTQALGSVYFERLVKSDVEYNQQQQAQVDGSNNASSLYSSAPPSLWIRNIQVIVYTIIIKFIIRILFANGNSANQPRFIIQDDASLLYRSFLCIFMLTLLSLFAVVYVAVLRYADNVLYGITSGNTTALIALIGMPMSKYFSFQLLLACCSVFACTYYFNYPLPDSVIIWLQRTVPSSVSPYIPIAFGQGNNNDTNNTGSTRVQHRYESLVATNNTSTYGEIDNQMTGTGNSNLTYAAEPFLPR